MLLGRFWLGSEAYFKVFAEQGFQASFSKLNNSDFE